MSRSTALVALLFLGAGCAGKDASGPPPVAVGTDACAVCGMIVKDPHYAAAVRDGARVLAYDAIECLVRARRQAGGSVSDAIWIADVDTGALHPQSAVTVVQGGYPSPMGGGFAAFSDPARARAEAEARGGAAGTLADAVSGALGGRTAR
jgi:copper chaperone NosL